MLLRVRHVVRESEQRSQPTLRHENSSDCGKQVRATGCKRRSVWGDYLKNDTNHEVRAWNWSLASICIGNTNLRYNGRQHPTEECNIQIQGPLKATLVLMRLKHHNQFYRLRNGRVERRDKYTRKERPDVLPGEKDANGCKRYEAAIDEESYQAHCENSQRFVVKIQPSDGIRFGGLDDME